MATVATLTRKIYVPNYNASGSALDAAISTLITAISGQTVTLGPFKYTTTDNQFTVLEVSWPSTSDTAFVSGGSMASVASSLGLAILQTEQVSSTSAY